MAEVVRFKVGDLVVLPSGSMGEITAVGSIAAIVHFSDGTDYSAGFGEMRLWMPRDVDALDSWLRWSLPVSARQRAWGHGGHYAS